MEFERKVWVNNTVITLGFPIDMVKWLGMTEDSIVVIKDETGKHGNYVSIWVKPKGKK